MESMENYNRARQILNNVCTQYYTYTPKENKPKNILLKGLSNEEDTNEILEELKTYESDELKPISCVQFASNTSKINKTKLAIYLIQITAESNINALHKIKYIQHQRIKWEKLKSSNNIMQCKNCQRFGHSAINCNLSYRCVKCDKNHQPQQCKLTKNEESIPYCTNCMEMGHPASFRGCPVYKKIIKKIQDAKLLKQQTKEQSRRFSSNYIKPGVSYADVFNTNNTSKVQMTTNENNNNTTNLNAQILQKLDAFQKYMIENDKRIQTLFNAISSIMNE